MTAASADCAQIEAAFRSHPAVKEVRAFQHPGPQFTCWVIATDEALAPPPASDAARVTKWRKVFDLMQGGVAPGSGPAVSALPQPPWTSSFTRQPFSSEEMDEWLNATLRLVRSFRPRRILELGCGAGVLLSRLAPECERYVGTDLSPRSLESLARYLSQAPALAPKVTLMERPADDFSGLDDDAFDLVLINSVVQYFPNEPYLRAVLEGEIAALRVEIAQMKSASAGFRPADDAD